MSTVAHDMSATDGAAVTDDGQERPSPRAAVVDSLDPGLARSSETPLPERQLDHAELDAPVWLLGVHGGAGESSLATLFSGVGAAEHQWPVAPDDHGSLVVLCARSNFWGMRRVQAAMRQWNAVERHNGVRVVGLALVADRPGKLPRPLQELAVDLESATPRMWRLPWIDAWSLGEIPSPGNSPKAVHAFGAGLNAAVKAAAER